MSGFDRLARPYRWLEYLSFGRALERCRLHFLPQLADTRRALLLGDGDGRFAERLLRTMVKAGAPQPALRLPDGSVTETAASEDMQVVAIDGSAGMLAILQSRCAFARNLLVTYLTDLTQGLPAMLQYDRFDLVTTHFFLDCLSTAQVDRLVGDVKPRMTANARWVVSEFSVPPRGAMRLPAWTIVRGLYLGFRLLTGLRTQRLPDYRSVLQAHGFVLDQQTCMLAGLLTSELWRLDKSPEPLES
ncbi:hypothetical protein Terro_3561 [Terriglobus roseus DSM 18391]|uniref:Methyltransferase domain-containing protein n=1 Tax=Terriglobus roseus (strain DSM 18391 / NRRL B-41598 / KBS 63) TaxID=926566 RepID=I3ZKK7_TERRK|nr:class I SAM-dependent methyltransferase [Terriglobus roseus]AFL89775.1 hypothetical protein Terro_3561 [Terriglobus roseus DSM 18391]